jgi:signal transduction histidine kinase
MSVALRRRLWDIGVPALLVAVSVVALYVNDPSSPRFEFRGSPGANVAFLLATCAPLVWRRRHPLAVCVAFLAAQAAWHVALYPLDVWDIGSSGPPPDAPILAGMVAFFSLGRRSQLTVWDWAALLVASFFFTQIALGTVGEGGTIDFGAYGWWIGALILGQLLRDRERLIGLLRDRSARLEREREQEAARATLEERARIARELHDVIAHAVSVIVVQASAERSVLPAGQSSTREVLAAIEEAGREALGELRRLLGVLRAPGRSERLTPQPGLGALGVLVEEGRRAGQAVSVRVEGDPIALPAGLDLVAYRIVQEVLTNARKHAAGARVAVTLRWRPAELAIEVLDDGPGPARSGNGTGHGLIGLRERAALYGGSIEAGAAGPGGGYRVRARLPIEASGA